MVDQGGPCATNPQAIEPSLGGDGRSDREDGDARVQASGKQVVNPLSPILRGAPVLRFDKRLPDVGGVCPVVT